jgi:NAD(P)-dependent dehydrogenase (short-subunit alcohol dehydrogenase family)
MGWFDNKVALVTGASKPNGIGYAVAIRLAAEGAHVVVTDLCEQMDEFPGYCRTGSNEELEALAEKVKESGVKSAAVPLDVTDPAAVSAMAERVDKEFGSLDVLVNNAGGSPGPNAIENLDESAWLKVMDINLNGTFRVSKAMIPLLKKGAPGGAIVNTSSRAGKVPGAFMGSYCTSKAGVIMLTKVLAQELAKSGIRVNCICPGQVRTDLGEWGWKMKAFATGKSQEEFEEEFFRSIPLGRPATPADCANVIAWLASDQASYLTGQAINVTGGQLMEV